MLKALVKVQMGSALRGLYNRTGAKRKRRKANGVLMAIVGLYLIASLGFSFGFFFKTMLESFVPLGLTWLYFALSGLTAFVFSFVGSVFLSQTVLFNAKDNDLLLSLPIKPRLILLSRTLTLYLMSLLIQLLVLVPAMVVYLLYGQASAITILMFVITTLLLPLPVLALSMLLGWLLAMLSDRIRHKNIITILFSLLFLVAYFVGYAQLMNAMNDLVQRGREVADAVRTAIPPAYHYGISLAHGTLSSLLWFAVFCIVPFVLLMAVMSTNYTKTLTTKRGAPRIAYKGGQMREGSPMKALIVKETRLFFAKPIYLMNTGIYLLFMLGLPLYLLFDRSVLTMITQTFGLNSELLGPISATLLCLLSASTFISSPSISLEGKNLWLVQSLPVRPITWLLSKALAHFLISLPFILVSGILLGVLLKLHAVDFALTLLLPLAASAFAALLGLVLNLRFPKLNWRNEAEPIKQSMSPFLAMSLGFMVPAGLAALYIFVLAEHINVQLYLLLCTLFFLLLSILFYLYLNKTADKASLDLSEA